MYSYLVTFVYDPREEDPGSKCRALAAFMGSLDGCISAKAIELTARQMQVTTTWSSREQAQRVLGEDSVNGRLAVIAGLLAETPSTMEVTN